MKWLIQNAKQRAAFAVKNPRYALGAMLRELKPECVVETGIANGVSSAYILLALHRNQRGTLHSIGLPDPLYLPDGKEAGWFVPKWLRKPWRVEIAYPFLRLGELLFADDALWNSAFEDFARKVGTVE